ncbi:MAG TPA: hypothetical protein VGH29_07720 [Candidatus Binataceae bacterium]
MATQSQPATIAEMRVGDRGYADPNALAPLRDGTSFLLGTFPLHASPDPVARMLVERIAGGWVVHASEVKDPNWRISRGLPWPGVGESDLMPVVQIL